MNFCEGCEIPVTICKMCGRQLKLDDEVICFKNFHFCGKDCLNDFGTFHDENVVVYNESLVVEENEI